MSHELTPITTAAQYDLYLAEVRRLVTLDPEPHTEAGKWLCAVSTAVEDYEKIHYQFPKPGLIAMLWFRMRNRLGLG